MHRSSSRVDLCDVFYGIAATFAVGPEVRLALALAAEFGATGLVIIGTTTVRATATAAPGSGALKTHAFGPAAMGPFSAGLPAAASGPAATTAATVLGRAVEKVTIVPAVVVEQAAAIRTTTVGSSAGCRNGVRR